MKKLFKGWTKFEIIFLIVSLSAITICFLFNEDKNVLSLVTSLLGVIVVLTGAKGLLVSPFINIFYNILYIIISISQRYYGEVLIYIFLMMPLHITTIISWLKNKSNKDSNVVSVNKLNRKEYMVLGLVTVLVTFMFYFILKLLDTNELIISTISLTASLVASYLMLRRSSNYAIAFVINDIILITLWGIACVNDIALLPMVVTFMVFFVNDIYGFISWKKREKEQYKKES
ncbi:MAG: nicotinamide riboside transporter PnuC [Candidatus Coprovivens sp.]